MVDIFTKYAGLAQTAIGVLGAASPDVASALGTGTGANGLNVLSGLALSYLGFKGSAAHQRTGALSIGTLNAIVGVLGMLGISNIAGIPLNVTAVGNIINLAIGAWGILSGLMAKK
jgi:hypothetical protein